MTSKIIKSKEPKKENMVDEPFEKSAVVHKRVLDARTQAEEMILKAEEKAKKIIAEADKIREKAKTDAMEAVKKGLADGESKGLAKVTEKLVELSGMREEFYASAEPEVIKLVMAIAEKVIGRLAQENSELIFTVVRQALEKEIGDRLTVRMNPADYKNIMAGDHEFKEVMDRTKRLVFREDESIACGGCIVETEVGTIDARLETQLAAIKKAMGV